MEKSKKVIVFSAVCTVISAIITYFISVNMEACWITVDSIWISNNFLLTVMGGVLTGFIVTLIIEYKNYIDKKMEAETEIFFQTFYLYQQLFIMHERVSDYISHPDQALPKGMLNDCAYKAECQKNAIISLSYNSFRKKNLLKKAHDDFCKKLICEIEHVIGHRFYLDIAINNAEIDALKKCGSSISVTSSNEQVGMVMKKLQRELEALTDNVGDFLSVVNKYCKNRYKWDQLKATIDSSYKSIFEFETFEEYIQQDE